MDADNSGTISRDELVDLVRKMQQQQKQFRYKFAPKTLSNQVQPITTGDNEGGLEQEVDQLMKDVASEDQLTYEEFQIWWQERVRHTTKSSKRNIELIFLCL